MNTGFTGTSNIRRDDTFLGALVSTQLMGLNIILFLHLNVERFLSIGQ
jgi:hypothetical protein